MIRKATISDLQKIKQLTESCALALQEKGVFQWNEKYPSLETLQQDISREELFLLEEENQILGMVVLTEIRDPEYIPIRWLTPNSRNLYIHRFATHPSVWGSGFGQQLMDFAEDFAKTQGFISVRLDTFSQNLRNQLFYQKRGYQRLGNIYFPKQSKFPFYCYEKPIG